MEIMTDAEGNFWLEDRIMKIQSVVEQYGEDQFYISYSGGRDSTVLHYLIDEALPGNRIPRVYFNTGIEFQVMVDFVKALQEIDCRIEIVKPQVPIKKMLEKEGYPFKAKDHSKKVREYQRKYEHSRTTYDYANRLNHYSGRYGCPKCLQHQFSSGYSLKISEKCCDRLKKDIGKQYQKEHQRSWVITGIMKAEGGARASAGCIVLKTGGNKFHPLFPIAREWIDWYVEARNIHLCPLYYPPYNFKRTGCKGCPFALGLQQELDVIAEHFPAERRQCELIWKPVYEEYRRLGYRLRKDEGQTSLFEFD